MNILLDILLALPLLGVVWALLGNGVALLSLIKAVVALAVLFVAVVFVPFPGSWIDGSLLYPPLRTGADFILRLCGVS